MGPIAFRDLRNREDFHLGAIKARKQWRNIFVLRPSVGRYHIVLTPAIDALRACIPHTSPP